MSVDNASIKQSFTMDGVTTAFTLTLSILTAEPESIKACVINATNTRTTLTYDTEYTVTVNAEGDGGVIKVADAESAADTLFVYRETSDLQESAYEDFNQFPAATVEADLDRRTMIAQEAKDDLARALKFSVTTTNLTGSTLPTPVAGLGLVWSGTDGTLVNSIFPIDSSSSLAISAATVAQGAATSASVFAANALASQYAASTSATLAAAEATAAASSATFAAQAAKTVAQITVTTSAEIALEWVALSTIGSLAVTTNATIAALSAPLFSSTTANITGLTVGTLNITNMDTVTVGSMTITTSATIEDLKAALFSATTANITGLTVGTLNITNMDTVTAGSITVTTDATIAMAIIENATIATLTLTTAATANMMDMAAATAGNLLVTTTATIQNAIIADAVITASTITGLTVTTINISAGTIAKQVNIAIATTGATPTWTNQQHYNNLFGSAGRATGGEIASASTTSVHVSAGTGFIKATDSDTAELLAFDFGSASSITVATNTTTYIYVDYNSGVPTIATTTLNNSWDLDTSWPLGSVVQEGGKCHILNNPWWVTDGTTNLIERLQAFGKVKRDDDIGGLILSADGTRQLAVTAGKLWSRINEFDIAALNFGDSFEMYWRTTSTIWTDLDVTTLSNIAWNDLATNTVAVIDNNKFVNFWVYVEADDLSVAVVMPQAQYVSSAAAEAEAPPSALPSHISTNAILIGRVIVKQATTEPVETQSAFTTLFGASQAADHGNLTGLADDDHIQYLLTSGARSQGTINVATSATIAALVATTASITNLTAGTLTVTGVGKALALTIGNLLVTTAGTIGLFTAGTLRCNTIATINVASIGTLFVNTSASVALLTCGNLSVKTTATIASGVITTLKSGPTTIGTLTVTTGATINSLSAGLLTCGNLSVNTTATIAAAVITALQSGPTTIGTLTVTTSASIASLSAPLISSTTSTITNITATTISIGATQIYNKISKGILIETPGGAEDLTLFKVASAATITEMYAVVKGTSPSVTWVIKHGTDRSGGGASVLTAGTTTTDLTTGDTITVFSDATIAANSWVWLVTTATSGTISSLGVSINYTMDA